MLQQSDYAQQYSRGKETHHASAVACTLRASVMARTHGMLLGRCCAISTSPRTFCPLHRRLCSLSSMAPRQTHAPRLPSKLPPSRDCLRAHASKARCLLCSRWLLYEHQCPSPIAQFGGRLHATTCETEDVRRGPAWCCCDRKAPWLGMFVRVREPEPSFQNSPLVARELRTAFHGREIRRRRRGPGTPIFYILVTIFLFLLLFLLVLLLMYSLTTIIYYNYYYLLYLTTIIYYNYYYLID